MSDKGLVDTVPTEVYLAYETRAKSIAEFYGPNVSGALKLAILKFALEARLAGVEASAQGPQQLDYSGAQLPVGKTRDAQQQDGSSYTPGPWETDRVGIYGCKDGVEESIMLASVYADGGLDQNEHVSNAILMAAAPDLLETLEWVRRNYAAGSTRDINARIAAALAKAQP